MPLTFERKLPIILFFVFLMLTTVGVLFYQNTMSAQDAMTLQKQSQDVISRVDDLLTSVFISHSALYNFMSVTNDTYLDPFERAKPRMRQDIEGLRTLLANNQDQLDEVNRIDQAVKQYVAEVSAKIDRRKIEGRDAIEIPWNEGDRTLSQIRLSAERIKAMETAKLQRRDERGDLTFTITVWVLIVSSLAGIIGLGVANLTVFSEIKKRRAAQTKLLEANEGLERNVEERTAELKEANDRLVDIGREREIILASEKDARREAEIANRLRDEFMASVSHELRTPLNSILGWARLMKGGTLDDNQSEKALATIIKNSETQNRLIEDLLDVARVISGKLQLEMVDLNAWDIVAEAVETVRPAAEARNIQIEFVPHHVPALIHGDRNRLVQVFTNLLGNAIKFSHERSSVQVSVEDSGDSLTVEIRDEGKGISPEFLPLVFERFRQDVANKSNNGGLGLGLAIVRNLVEMHHGCVRAESEGENQGATFTVVLPLVQPKPVESPEQPETAENILEI